MEKIVSHILKPFVSFAVYFVLQGVHIGNLAAETDEAYKQPEKTDWYQAAHSVQQKSHSPVKPTDSSRKKAEQDGKPRVKPSGWTCGECLQWFPERDSYVSHMKTKHGKVITPKHVLTAVRLNISIVKLYWQLE